MGFFIAVITGFATGILSSWGIGGGTLLILCMTLFAAVDESAARGINLLYFLPTAAAAMYNYKRQKLIDFRVWLPASITGCIFAGLSAWLAQYIDNTIPRMCFGVLLLYMGVSELLSGLRRAKDTLPASAKRR
ncbi:UPF0721 transmembrane protein [Clostridia bacterium]|nr:UPF0721 transmembrane protein [Clostridia bacterium]